MYTRSPKVYAKRTVALFLTLKNKQGVVLTSEKDQAERWVEHFKQVINHPDPDETANIEPYSKTDFTLLLKILILVFKEYKFDFQIGPKMENAVRAFPIVLL